MKDRLRSLVVRFRESLSARRGLVLAGIILAGVFLLLLLAPNREVQQGHPSVPLLPEHVSPNSEILSPEDLRLMGGGTKEANALRAPRALSELYKAAPGDRAGLFQEPRIAYSAELTVVTKEFAHSRSTLEEILDRHHGYVASSERNISTRGQSGLANVVEW
jgi:hypothetical protein